MNISFNSNPSTSPVFVKNGLDTTPILAANALSAVGNGAEISTADKTKLLFVVTGNFVGYAEIYGKRADTGANEDPGRYIDTSTGMEINRITKPGIYCIENRNPYTKMWIRVSSISSGTLTAYAFDWSAMEVSKLKRHIVKVTDALGGVVSANSYGQPIINLDINQYAFLVLVARTDTAHSHRVGITFVHPNSLGSMTPEVNIFSSTEQRDGESDWIPNKGEKCTITVHNDDTSNSHAYDIIIYGVS